MGVQCSLVLWNDWPRRLRRAWPMDEWSWIGSRLCLENHGAIHMGGLFLQGRNSLQAGSGREVRAEMDGDGYDVIVNLKRGKRFMPGSTASWPRTWSRLQSSLSHTQPCPQGVKIPFTSRGPPRDWPRGSPPVYVFLINKRIISCSIDLIRRYDRLFFFTLNKKKIANVNYKTCWLTNNEDNVSAQNSIKK